MQGELGVIGRFTEYFAVENIPGRHDLAAPAGSASKLVSQPLSLPLPGALAL